MDIVIVPILGIFLTTSLQCIEANLSLDFKVTKISASPANCNVANTTYAHGETFKLDCKTQCVCENGRHACSSLCPKEQLPAPEDTISCRSPRLVEVPGHCCKMWLCENPTADVYATCHNSSTSPWTPCSQPCGLGISTRFTATAAGCNQLINQRLCDNRKCETTTHWDDRDDLRLKTTHYLSNGIDPVEEMVNHKYDRHLHQHHDHDHHKQRMKKSHECRHLERLGPARIRLGQCVSRKLYRPKVCGHCHQSSKCCMPSVSTTIQVELLCPLNAADPISIVQQQEEQQQQQEEQQPQEFYGTSSLTSLWDTHSLDGIDQEYFQSHQIHIQNKFIAIEWILKCECSENDDCGRSVKFPHRRGNNGINNENSNDDVNDNNNNDGGLFNTDNNNKKSRINQQDDKDNNADDDYDYFGLYGKVSKNNYKHRHLQHIDDNSAADHDDDGGGHASGDTILARSGHNRETERHTAGRAPNDGEEAAESPSSISANSDEIQPDIIPYPPPPFTTNDRSTNIIISSSSIRKHNGKVNSNMSSKNINSSHKSTGQLLQMARGIDEDLLIERQQEKAQQEKYFYQQWLLQQQQQKSQQSLLEQLLGT